MSLSSPFEPSLFEAEFWEIYPRKKDCIRGSKKLAATSWGKLSQMDRLMAIKGLTGYALYIKLHASYQPLHVATYLNNRRWEDFCPPGSGDGVLEPAQEAPRAVFQRDPYDVRSDELHALLPDHAPARRAAEEGWLGLACEHYLETGVWPRADLEPELCKRAGHVFLDIRDSLTLAPGFVRELALGCAMTILERNVDWAERAGVTGSIMHRALDRLRERLGAMPVKTPPRDVDVLQLDGRC